MLIKEEKWIVTKDVSYEDIYSITRDGRIYKYLNNRIYQMKPYENNKHGYLTVGLTSEGVQTIHYLHKLVAEAFLPNENNCKTLKFKDGNVKNVNVDNLQWLFDVKGDLPEGCRWCVGYEGKYYINVHTEVFNKDHEQLEPSIIQGKYPLVFLSLNGKKVGEYITKLYKSAFS